MELQMTGRQTFYEKMDWIASAGDWALTQDVAAGSISAIFRAKYRNLPVAFSVYSFSRWRALAAGCRVEFRA
jgi:hypothetical protein